MLTVWEPYRPHLLAPVSGTIAVASGLAKEYDDASVEVATKTAEEGVELAAAAGFDAQPLVAHGRPKDAIVEAAEEHQARAVVLGSHGQGGAESVVYGSVSTAVLHRSPAPVLVVRGPQT